MKRKVKRYDGGGYGRFVEESPKSVEDMKIGIAAGSPAVEEDTGMRAGKNLAFEPDTAPKAKPRPKPAKPAEKAEESSLDTMEDASRVMRRGLAGQRPTQRMTNAPLDKLKADRKEREFNEARKAAAEERRNTARSTTSAVPYSSISPFKKGGMAKSASARADGCAIRGKTRA